MQHATIIKQPSLQATHLEGHPTISRLYHERQEIMTDQLAVRQDMSVADIAQNFVKSGFFSDTRDASQAIVKIMAGREFGYGPFASMTGIYIIQGRPTLSANLMASAVKSNARYDYRVRQMDDKACKIEFLQRINNSTTFETSAYQSSASKTHAKQALRI